MNMSHLKKKNDMHKSYHLNSFNNSFFGIMCLFLNFFFYFQDLVKPVFAHYKLKNNNNKIKAMNFQIHYAFAVLPKIIWDESSKFTKSTSSVSPSLGRKFIHGLLVIGRFRLTSTIKTKIIKRKNQQMVEGPGTCTMQEQFKKLKNFLNLKFYLYTTLMQK